MLVSRNEKIVTVSDDTTGRVIRALECRNVPCAVALEAKLTSDPAFSAQWVRNTEPRSPEVKRHRLEREWA